MRKLILPLMLAAFYPAMYAAAQTLPGNKLVYTMTPVRISQMKTTSYLYASTETTLNDLDGVIQATMDQFTSLLKSAQFTPTGGPIFVYKDSTGDRTKPFTFEIGYPVSDDVKPVGGFQIGKLEGHKEATTIYFGPIRSIGQAYGRIYEQIIAAGLIPGNERREHWLFYEDDASPNSVVLIEIDLKNQ